MDLLDLPEGAWVLGDGPFSRSDSAAPEGLCLDQEEAVLATHRSWLDAGATLIGTNSLFANAPALEAAGLGGHTNEINWKASQLAKSALSGSNGIFAGRVGPLSTDSKWEEIFQEQIGALLDGGARLLLFQEFHHLGQLLVALEMKQTLHHCPAICLCSVGKDGLMAGGESLSEAWDQLETAGADLLGLETDLHFPSDQWPSFSGIRNVFCLRAVDDEGNVTAPDEFAQKMQAAHAAGACILLGGRGTHPEHILKAIP